MLDDDSDGIISCDFVGSRVPVYTPPDAKVLFQPWLPGRAQALCEKCQRSTLHTKPLPFPRRTRTNTALSARAKLPTRIGIDSLHLSKSYWISEAQGLSGRKTHESIVCSIQRNFQPDRHERGTRNQCLSQHAPCFFRALFLVSSSKSEGFRLGLYLRLLRLNPSPAS